MNHYSSKEESLVKLQRGSKGFNHFQKIVAFLLIMTFNVTQLGYTGITELAVNPQKQSELPEKQVSDLVEDRLSLNTDSQPSTTIDFLTDTNPLSKADPVETQSQAMTTQAALQETQTVYHEIQPAPGDTQLLHDATLQVPDVSTIPNPANGIVISNSAVLPPGMTMDEWELTGDWSLLHWLTHIEVQAGGGIDLSNLAHFVVGMKSPEPIVQIEFRDTNRDTAKVYLVDVDASSVSYYSVSMDLLSSKIDIHKVDSIRFTIDGDHMSDNTFKLTLNKDTTAPPKPTVTTSVTSPISNQDAFRVEGIKPEGAGVLINGFEAVPVGSSKTWSYDVPLGEEGNNAVSVRYKWKNGVSSEAFDFTVLRDTIAPAGSIVINGGGLYTTSRTVTLNLSGTDSGTGLDKMSFSTDGTNWTTSEVYLASKSFTLPAGDGEKTIYVKYFDKAGNESTIYSQSITLATTPPVAALTVNNGAQYITQTAVTLNISIQNAGVGIDKMMFSTDNLNWTTIETYNATRAWTFSTGDGLKTVWAKFQDKAGQWSSPVSVSVRLDTYAPFGSLRINSGASYTGSANVMLNLSAYDYGSGVDKMSFSTDKTNWTAPEAFAATKSYTLSSGDGYKVVYVRYYDKAGKMSSSYGAGIRLDTAPPQISYLRVNNGAQYISQTAVTLNFYAYDMGSGISQMSFSSDNSNWTTPETYKTTKAWTFSSGDGNKTVWVKFRDNMGLWSNSVSVTVKLDTVPPVGWIKINNGALYTTSSYVTLNLSAQDSGSGISYVRFSTDNVNWTSSYTYSNSRSYSLPTGDGSKTVWVKFQDKAGTWSNPVSSTIILDTTIPTGSITINNGEIYTSSTVVTLKLTAQDAGSGINKMSFSTNNSTWTTPEAFSATKNFTLPTGDGSKTVYVRYYDKAGKVSTVYSKSIMLDTVPPQGTIAVNNGAQYIKQTNVALNLSATDSGSGLDKMSFSTDNITYSEPEVYSTTKSWDFSGGDGNKTVWVKFLDKASKSSSPVSVTVLLDTVLPTGSVQINNGAFYSNTQTVTLNLSGQDSASGIDKMSFSTDNANWTTPEIYATSKSFSLPAGDGTKTIYVKFFDKAGNASSVTHRAIILDTTAPQGTISVNGGVQYITQTHVTLNVNASDSGSGLDKMSFSTDNANWTTAETYKITKSWDFTVGDGNKTVWVKFLDKSGTWSSPVSVAVFLDTILPTGSVTINAGASYTTSNSVTLNLSAQDSGAGIETMSFSTDNISWTEAETYSSSKNFSFPSGDGTKTVYVQFFDKAGNASTICSNSISLDATSPTGSLEINYGAAYATSTQVTLRLSAADTGSGISKMSFSTNNVSWTASENYTTLRNFTLPSGDGNKTIYVKYFDKAGNESTIYSQSIFLDKTVPTGSVVINHGDVSTTSRTVTLTFAADDGNGAGVSSILYSLDGGSTWSAWQSYVPELSVLLPDGNGEKTVKYKIRDAAGNESSYYEDRITLNMGTDPVLFLDDFNGRTSLGANWTVQSGSFSIGNNNLWQSVAGVPGQIVLANAPSVNNYEIDFDMAIRSWDVDQVGLIFRKQDLQNYYLAVYTRNYSSGYFKFIKVVNGASTVLTQSSTPIISDSLYHHMKVIVNGNQFEMVFDGETRVTAQDGSIQNGTVGIYSQMGSEFFDNFVVKNSGITVSLPVVNPLPQYTTAHLRTISGTKTSGTSIWINGVEKVPSDVQTSWSVEVPLSADGNYTFSIFARDGSGSKSNVVEVSTVRDTIAPSGSVIINNGASKTSSANISLALNVEDETSGLDSVRLSTDGGTNWTAWENFQSTKTLTLSSGEGEKTVLVEVRDHAGLTQTFSDSILLTTATPPAIQFLSSAVTASPDYVLRYTVNGVEKTENWKLHTGENRILVRALDRGLYTYSDFVVTFNGTEPSLPAMPTVPVLSSDLVSMTTEDGLVVKYDQGNLVAIEKTDDYELYLPVFNGDVLTGGLLVFKNGDKLLFEGGHALYKLSSDGATTRYNADNFVTSIVGQDQKIVRFSYQLDPAGKVIGTLMSEQDMTSFYDGAGLPVWFKKTDGTDIRYVNGSLHEYKDNSGNYYLYEINGIYSGVEQTGSRSTLIYVTPAGTSTPLPIGEIQNNLASYPTIKATLESKIPIQIDYDMNHQMTKVISGKEEELALDNGLPESLMDQSKSTMFFTALTNEDGDIENLALSQNGIDQSFNQTGNLNSITLSDGTVLEVNAEKLNEIQAGDGSVLANLTWNGAQLTGYVRTYEDGTVETYQNSTIKTRQDSNGNITTYTSGQPITMKTPDGRTYQISSGINTSGKTERKLDLISIDLDDGRRIEFENGKPIRYIQTKDGQSGIYDVPVLPDGTYYVPSLKLTGAELRAVTIDPAGSVLSGEILFSDGTQYLIENGLLKQQITPSGQMVKFSEEEPEPIVPTTPVPAQPLTEAEQIYRNQLIEKEFEYFTSSASIHALTELPFDNYDAGTHQSSNYSQATLAGFWAEILVAIAKGDYVTSKITREQAFQKLVTLLSSLKVAQQQAGWNGMFSFFTIKETQVPVLDPLGNLTGQTQTVVSYERTFNSIGLGDNLNLSVSLSSVIGALTGLSLDPALSVLRDQIISKSNDILTAQDPGYAQFYNSSKKQFNMAYEFSGTTGSFAGQMDRLFNEFRTGLFWLVARHPEYTPALEKLAITIRPYESSDGLQFNNAVPFDGGAFQMFWPLIYQDETQYSEFNIALRNFLYAQADYVSQQEVPGLLSAGSNPGGDYVGKIGLPEASETDDHLLTDIGSIYGTASAFGLAPHYVLQFLKNIETKFPQVKTAYGYVDSLAIRNVTTVDPVTLQPVTTKQPVYSSRYYGIDQASFLLALLKTSQNYYQNYLTQKNMKNTVDQIYQSFSLGLTPVMENNPTAGNFGITPSILYGGSAAHPDGLSPELIKRPAFVTTVVDPEYGAGQVVNYFTPTGKFHHPEIEFPIDDTNFISMNLQEYLLTSGDPFAGKSLFEDFILDLLDESYSLGTFYTSGYGSARQAITQDPLIGAVRHLQFDLKYLEMPVGIWALYHSFDISKYDFLSVPVRLGKGTPKGTRLKFELKGLGEIFVTDEITEEWTYLNIPKTAPMGALTEIAVSILSPDGGPVAGDIYIGPLSLMKVRSTKSIDWKSLVGKTESEIRMLLIQNAKTQPSGGSAITGEEVLENFSVDADGKLVSGTRKLVDGSVQYFKDGHLTKWIFPNGRTIVYANGLASYIIDLARGKLEEGKFYYDQDLRGNIRQFIVEDNDRRRVFGSDGKLQSINDKGRIINFEDGKIKSIVLSNATLTNLEFASDQKLLSAHVAMSDGSSFDINQGGDQFVQYPDGVKVYYRDTYITAIETPQNGRTEFSYQFDAARKLIGVTATFNGQAKSMIEFIQMAGREVEKSYLLDKSPMEVIPISGIYGFNANPNDLSVATKGSFGDGAAIRYQFQYKTITPDILGMVFSHKDQPIEVSGYDFLGITLMQDSSMTWGQDFELKLKSPELATRYVFEVDNAQNSYKTYVFSLDGKSGEEGETTLEVIRDPAGLSKLGQIYIKNLTYYSVRRTEKPLWETILNITGNEIQSLKIETEMLTAVGADIAQRKAITITDIQSMLDLPTSISYVETGDGKDFGKVKKFVRFDGSQVELENNMIKKVILPDGTVNEYQTNVNETHAEIEGGLANLSDKGSMDYKYGALRKVTQSDGREYEFSYEYDDAGTETTLVKDELSGDVRRFQDGKLLRSDTTQGLKTNYQYANGVLIGAEIAYKNKVLQSSQYHFTDEETQVTDEDGTTWFYDKNGNLIKHITKDGYLYTYSDFQFSSSYPYMWKDDYKRALIDAKDLRAVTLSGFQAADGSQILYGFDKGTKGEIKFANGDHGVNLEFDEELKIKSGQIQFANGMILEIENYLPVRGRLETGELFDVPYPMDYPVAYNPEFVQGADGGYLGFKTYRRVELYKYTGIFRQFAGYAYNKYTYDRQGRLIKVETPQGTTDDITYQTNAAGEAISYSVHRKKQFSYQGVAFPKPIELLTDGGSQRLMDSGKEVARHDGDGFLVAVYKEAEGQWLSFSGTFSSAADRLGLKNFLENIKNGEYMVLAVNDPQMNQIRSDISSLLKDMGARPLTLGDAESSGGKYLLMGNKNFLDGNGHQAANKTDLSSTIESEEEINKPITSDSKWSNNPLIVKTAVSANDAYSAFMVAYQSLKPSEDIQKSAVYGGSNQMMLAERLDGQRSYYQNGRIKEVFNGDGNLVYSYEYVCPVTCNKPEDYLLSKVNMVKARQDLVSDEIEQQHQIEQTKYDALQNLAWQDEVARAQIQENLDSGIAAIDGQISSYESQKYQEIKKCKNFMGFKYGCHVERFEVPGVQDAINQLRSQRTELLQTAETQLSLIPGEVDARKQEIENAIADRLIELGNQKKDIERDILKREVEPVLSDYYRRILGRDPSSAELEYWTDDTLAKYQPNAAGTNTPSVDTTLLYSRLNDPSANSEKTRRLNEKQAIISGVRTFLTNYVTAQSAAKEAMLNQLKLQPGDVVDLDSTDVSEILAWLESRDLHFGQSAYLALKEMLASRGINVAADVLGKELILIDILMGLITRFLTGELVLSAYAMMKVAAIHNDNFSTVQYTYADLLNLYRTVCPSSQTPCSLRIIAHIAKDHYIQITNVTETEVFYREVSKGENGEDLTIDKDQFLETWDVDGKGGYLIVPTEKVMLGKEVSKETALKIQGAFLPFLFFVISFVLTVASAVVSIFSPTWGKILGYAALVAGIIGIVGSVGQWVVNGVKMAYSAVAQQGFFGALKSGFAAIGHQMMQAVHYVGRFFQNAFQFVKNGFSGGFKTLGSGIMKINTYLAHPEIAGAGSASARFSVEQIVSRNIIAASLNYNLSKGFEGFGLNNTFTRLASAFIGFGAVGIGGSTSSFIQSGLQGLMLQGVSEIGLKLDLPPPVTQALSLVGSAALGAYFNPNLTLKAALIDIAPQVTSKLTLGGIEFIGRSMGLNPRIAQLIGLPVSAIVGNLTGRFSDVVIGYRDDGTAIYVSNPYNEESIWSTLKRSILNEATLSGMVSIGSSLIGDALDVNPVLISLGLRGLVGGVQGLTDTLDQRNAGARFLVGMTGGLKDTVEDLVKLGGKHLTLTEKTFYLSQLVTFATQKGSRDIFDFFEEYANDIIGRNTAEAILKSGHNVSEYFKAKRQAKDFTVTTLDNVSVHEYTVGDSKFILTEDETQLLARKFGNHMEKGEYVFDKDGNYLLRNGEVVFTNGSETLHLTIRETEIVQIDMVQSGGNSLTFFGTADQPLVLSKNPEESFKIESGVLRNWDTGETNYYSDGKITAVQDTQFINFTTASAGPVAGAIQMAQYFDPEGMNQGFEIHMDEGLRNEMLDLNQSAINGVMSSIVDHQTAETTSGSSWIEQIQLKQQDLYNGGIEAIHKVRSFLQPGYDALKAQIPILQNDLSLDLLEAFAVGVVDTVLIGTELDDIFNEYGQLKNNWREMSLNEKTMKGLSIGGHAFNEIMRGFQLMSFGLSIRSVGKAVVGTVDNTIDDWVRMILKDPMHPDASKLDDLFRNAEFEAKWINQVDSVHDLKNVANRRLVDYSKARSKIFRRDAVEVNKAYPETYNPKPHKPGFPVTEYVRSGADLTAEGFMRIHGESNTVGTWLMRKTDFEALKLEAQNTNRNFAELLQERLALPTKPTMVSDFVPSPDRAVAIRESTVNPIFSDSPNQTQLEIMLEDEAEREFLKDWFKNTRSL